MPEPFTIHILVADGNPEGVKLISRGGWSGKAITFPRSSWDEAKNEKDLTQQAGIYILVGYDDDDELPRLYIGQTDHLRKRLNDHYQDTDFWDWAICFYASGEGLNRAYITWLEWALIQRAKQRERSHLDNAQSPTEPRLSDHEKADTNSFLNRIFQILPLVGLRAFEEPRTIKPAGSVAHNAAPMPAPSPALEAAPASPSHSPAPSGGSIDTVIVPAKEDTFNALFLEQDLWHHIRIHEHKLNQLKWIAAYRTAPISAITHIAEIDRIVSYGEGGKFLLYFKGKARQLEKQIPFGDATGPIQGPRYTTKEKLDRADKVSDLYPKR